MQFWATDWEQLNVVICCHTMKKHCFPENYLYRIFTKNNFRFYSKIIITTEFELLLPFRQSYNIIFLHPVLAPTLYTCTYLFGASLYWGKYIDWSSCVLGLKIAKNSINPKNTGITRNYIFSPHVQLWRNGGSKFFWVKLLMEVFT